MSEQVAINTNAPHIVKRFWVAVALLGALLIGAAVLLLSLSAADMFERQVYPDRAIAEKLQAGQAACMHCPWYFRFESSPEAIRAILARGDLQQVESMPEFMESTIALSKEDWWIDSGTLERAQKYWVYYESPGNESKMRLMLVDGRTVYFASSGFPEPEKYRKVPLENQTKGTGQFLRSLRKSV